MQIQQKLPTVINQNLIESFIKSQFKNFLFPFSEKFAWKATSKTEKPHFIYSCLPDGSFMEYELDQQTPKNIGVKQVKTVNKLDTEMWCFGDVADIKKLY